MFLWDTTISGWEPQDARYATITAKEANTMSQSITSHTLWMAAWGLKKKPFARI